MLDELSKHLIQVDIDHLLRETASGRIAPMVMRQGRYRPVLIQALHDRTQILPVRSRVRLRVLLHRQSRLCFRLRRGGSGGGR